MPHRNNQEVKSVKRADSFPPRLGRAASYAHAPQSFSPHYLPLPIPSTEYAYAVLTAPRFYTALICCRSRIAEPRA